MKKIVFSLLVLAGITATAQVKVGNNPTTLATDANFQVEGTATTNQFIVLKNGNVGIGTLTPVTALTLGANSTGISFLGVGTSFNGGRLGGINAYRLDDGNGGLTFETFAGGSGGSEKMRITNTGNVVIGTGTTTPLSLLSLKASNPELGFYSPTSNLNNGKTSIIKSITENVGNGHLAFETYAGSFGGAERMRITNRGNVGIGTTTPTSILQVIGIPAFASDAAAGTAGLTAGAFWSTAGHATLPNGVLMVKL